MNAHGQVFHTNHYLTPHPGVHDTVWLEDSKARIKRIETLCRKLGDRPGFEAVQSVFADEDGYPFSICRRQVEGNHSETLFNIVMDLGKKTAVVVLGRPVAPEGVIRLDF